MRTVVIDGVLSVQCSNAALCWISELESFHGMCNAIKLFARLGSQAYHIHAMGNLDPKH